MCCHNAVYCTGAVLHPAICCIVPYRSVPHPTVLQLFIRDHSAVSLSHAEALGVSAAVAVVDCNAQLVIVVSSGGLAARLVGRLVSWSVVCLSVCLSVYVYLPVCLSACMPVCVCQSVIEQVSQSVSQSVNLSVCQSVDCIETMELQRCGCLG